MRHALDLCRLYAQVNRPVIFVGAVGSGKTTLARETHHLSGRAGPFVPISAGELTETLYADVLFGHVAGAYTGATRARKGTLSEASGGTLLLDDLATMPTVAQAAVLRVLESGCYRPLGSPRDEHANAQIYLASTIAPSELVQRGVLLRDLASRIGELAVSTPPLSARRTDIIPLGTHFANELLDEHGHCTPVRFTEEARAALLRYTWPANMRELRAVVERAVIHAGMEQDAITVHPGHLPERIRNVDQPSASSSKVTQVEVERALDQTFGNQSEAARMLGVHRNTIRRRLKRRAP